jgi:hypothetical protein
LPFSIAAIMAQSRGRPRWYKLSSTAPALGPPTPCRRRAGEARAGCTRPSRERLCERYYGSFERRIPVEDIEEDKVSAKFKNGVLTLTLPKRPEAQPKVKRIAIGS